MQKAPTARAAPRSKRAHGKNHPHGKRRYLCERHAKDAHAARESSKVRRDATARGGTQLFQISSEQYSFSGRDGGFSAVHCFSVIYFRFFSEVKAFLSCCVNEKTVG